MKADRIDRLAWFDKAALSFQQIQELQDRLTLVYDDGMGKITEIQLWEEANGWIGVPRQCSLPGLDLTGATDCTVWEAAENFPDFRGELRDGQVLGLKTLVNGLRKHPYGGILQASCGVGKSCSALALASFLKVPTLVTVHKGDLIDQWLGQMEQFYGITADQIGRVQQKKQDFTKPITMAMLQTLYSRQDELLAKGFFKYHSLIIHDEIQHYAARTFEAVSRLFEAKLRIGLTATPRRRDKQEKVFFWHIGPILSVMKGVELTGDFMQKEYHNPRFAAKIKEIGDNLQVAITMIAGDPVRNLKLREYTLAAYGKGRRVLVLTGRRKQVTYLVDSLRLDLLQKGEIASVSAYVGGMKKEELDEAAEARIIIGTYQACSEGTDLPDRDTAILATPTGDIEQTAGRIRRVHKGKLPLAILDIVDTGMGMCIGLGKKRRKQLIGMGFKEVKG